MREIVGERVPIKAWVDGVELEAEAVRLATSRTVFDYARGEATVNLERGAWRIALALSIGGGVGDGRGQMPVR